MKIYLQMYTLFKLFFWIKENSSKDISLTPDILIHSDGIWNSDPVRQMASVWPGFIGYHMSEIWDQISHTSVSQNWSHTSRQASVRSILRDTSVGYLIPNFTNVVYMFPHTDLNMFKMKWKMYEKMSENSPFYHRTYQQKNRNMSKTTALAISLSRCEKICRKLPFFWYIGCYTFIEVDLRYGRVYLLYDDPTKAFTRSR